MIVAPSGLAEALQQRYLIGRVIGRGGMATVYFARDLRYDRDVALKVLRPELTHSLGPEGFLREIQVTAKLQHPHILPVLDSGESAGQFWYTMPFVRGETLRQRLERKSRLEPGEAVTIVREVAEALTHAHAHGFVHRDVKPENILLAEGHALLADFGVAKGGGRGRKDPLSEPGLVVGSPAYMSPEQSDSRKNVDMRADEFALAAVAYEMFTGKLPYPGATPAAILARQHSGAPPCPASTLQPELPPAIDRVLEQALAPDAAKRFPNLTAFATTLDEALAGSPTPPPTRRRGVVLALALVALGIVAAALVVRSHWAFSGPEAVAVFPFQPNSQTARPWVETLPDLIATSLEGTPGFRIVDPWSLWAPLRKRRGDQATSPDPIQAEQLARAAGARWFVLGRVTADTASLQVILRVYRVGSADPAATLTTAGATDSLGGLAAAAAAQVIGTLWKDHAHPGSTPEEQFTTRSARALQTYLMAKEAMRRGLVDPADAAITESLRQDSSFGLALLEAVRIRSWVAYMHGLPYRGHVALITRVKQLGEPHNEHDRLRIEAMRASIYTEGRKGLAALRRIIELDSTDLEAWEMLGYNQMVYGWQYGAGAAESRASVERAVALDSTYAPTLAARTGLAIWYEEPVDLARQEKRLLGADTTSTLIRGHLLALRTVRDLNTGSARWLELASREPLPVWLTVFRSLRLRHPQAAARLIELTQHRDNLQVPHDLLAGADLALQLARGRFLAVEAGLHQPALRDHPALQQRLLLMLVIASLTGMSDTAVARRAARSLEQAVPIDSLAALASRQPVSAVGWAVGAWHASYGDTIATRRWQHALRAVPPDSENPREIDALRADLDARLAGRRGDLSGSLALGRRAYALWPFHANLGLDLDPEAATRFLLAVRLRQAGESDSAAALFDSYLPPRTWSALYTPRSSLELGELAERRGARAQAAEYYARTLVFWDLEEPATSAWRARAHAGLARVSGE